MKPTILYFYPNSTAFIRRDLEILSEKYTVKDFNLDTKHKIFLPIKLFSQLFFLLFKGGNSKAFVCHFAGYSSLLPAVYAKIFKKKCLIIVAGTDASKFKGFGYGSFVKTFYGLATKWSLNLASKILPVHESLVYQQYEYCDWGKPAQGYTVFAPKSKKNPFKSIYYGYDPEAFSPGTIAKIPNSFITVGNLQSPKVFIRKGNDLIIELARKRPDLSFTLVGWDGKMKFDFPGNVDLKPYMNQADLVKEMASHEFYFQLSVMEGFPNALAEAMLCGCIPIGSSVSGIPFIIGNTGYVLERRSVDELEKLVDQALADQRKNSLGKEARKRISEEFTYGRRLNELVSVIEE